MNDLLPICEVCLEPFGPDDLEDGVTISANCCERIGLCAHCRQFGNHDCDERATNTKGLKTMSEEITDLEAAKAVSVALMRDANALRAQVAELRAALMLAFRYMQSKMPRNWQHHATAKKAYDVLAKTKTDGL